MTLRRRISLLAASACVLACMFGGCVPSPTGGEDLFPQFSLLSTFYTPQDSNTLFVWQDSNAVTGTSVYLTRRYSGSVPCTLTSQYTVASDFELTNTSSGAKLQTQAVVTDSIVIESLLIDTNINAVTRLYGLLAVGSRWLACGHMVTSNGAIVVDSAVVDNYYASTTAAGKQYSNVYHVTYWIANVLSATQPVEAEFQKGATLGVYFAKTIGPTYVVAKDPAGRTLWTSQLVETRAR